MDKIVQRFMGEELSEPDIQALTGNLYDIILYEDIAKFQSLRQLLAPNNGIIILYQTTDKYRGHWISMWVDEERDVIMYFDSYGFAPDQEAKFAYYVSHNLPALLSNIIKQDGRRVDYNPYRVQRWSDTVSTCGRWVALRLRWKRLSHRRFAALFENNKLNGDMVITYLTFLMNDEDEMSWMV